jgi:putative membrane protein
MRQLKVGFTICLAIAASACVAGDRAPSPANDGAVGTSGAAAGVAAKNDANGKAKKERSDGDFVREMMADGKAEIALGELAQRKAQSPRVKALAELIVRDHDRSSAELEALAKQVGLQADDAAAEAAHREVRRRLAAMSGADFDRAYIAAMVEDHEKALDVAEDKADEADSDHVKQWAARILPTLEKHLDQARSIRKDLD